MVPLRQSFHLVAWTICFLLGMAAPLLKASDLPPPFIINLPFQANQATPVWLGHPETPQTTFATLNLPILPSDPNASLLVTVFFQEKEGGFLRITWQGTQGAQVLSDNFYEGIGMSNQRSLLVTPEIMAGEGTLSFQCGDTTLGIQRIKLEWLENKNGIVSPQIQDLLVTAANGTTQLAQNLSGQFPTTDPATWHDQLVTVPVTDNPQRIEQGVEFSVQLDKVPLSGRLSLKETGLSLADHLVVWINQQRAGIITPAVPDLTDEGYLTDDNTLDNYVGWREGSFYLPVSLLKAGVNTLQFSTENGTSTPNSPSSISDSSSTAPLAVKNVTLQLNYPSTIDTTVTPPPQPISSPTDSTPPPAPSISTPSTETNTP